MQTPIFTRYLARMERRQRAASTIHSFKAAVRDFERYCEQEDIDPYRITEEQVEAWAHGNYYAVTTRRMYYDHIRAAYRLAHYEGLVDRFVFINTEPPLIPQKKPRIISNAELRRMKADTVTEREVLIFHLAAYTGMRWFEMQKLRWDDIERTRNGWEFGVVGKQGKYRIVPIHPELQAVLGEGEGYIVGLKGGEKILSRGAWWKALQKFAAGWGFHDFRRTVASSLDANGVEVGLITRIMGWHVQSIFDKHYRNVADGRLHDAMLRLYQDSPI